ncbi:alpha/beta fold hydrolase [Stenotrophomonas tumulicola]|uniref:Alpha/beta hydrolase n=1 Tax=Stenotrophomonas tumulicola TaxID=1685415 RepID=A0A7W3FPS6_9GAMM|nr:alpha/beta hydrolase [Stenotrophomonas tumulicola]MBA8683402.1 alpha/beta hydrolase [Stenotrophomonas tumulicola]
MRLLATALLACLPLTAVAADSHGARLEGFDYPYPVKTFALESQRQPLEMAYLDLSPDRAAIGTVVLLHGKNFCAATWQESIQPLLDAGYRVIAPDQVGFCKSSKPQGYQYSFGQLAANTHALLQQLGVQSAHIVGHSMGGMLAARYALLYPRATQSLALVNPIGLEDWKALGVPWRSVDAWYANELKTSFDSIKKYQLDVYYDGDWKPRFEHWARMQAGMYAGPGKDAVAWSQALTSDMVFNQPVVYELKHITAPTTLFIGQKDRTAIGRDLAAPELKARLGDYPALGKAAATAIPGAQLVEFDDLGHSPQVQDPARFNTALLRFLDAHR